MSVFVDTGLFHALQNQRAQHHEVAVGALGAVDSGRFGHPYTSEYVFDEVVTPGSIFFLGGRVGRYRRYQWTDTRVWFTGGLSGLDSQGGYSSWARSWSGSGPSHRQR